MREISDEEILKSIYESGRGKIKSELDSKKRDKLSEYFFSLSNTLLGSLVVGIVLLMLENRLDSLDRNIFSISLFVGLLIVIASARIGYNLLK